MVTTGTDVKALPRRFPQFSYSILAGLSGVVIGTAFAWSSAATRLTRTFGNNDCAVNRDIDDPGWYVDAAACYFMGTSVGGLVMGPVTRMIGYRWSVIACDTVVLVGWLLLSQVNWTPVWTTRLAHGIGTGGLGLLTPTYIAHITDFRIRGRALMFHHAFVCFGVFYAHALSAIVTNAQLIGLCMIWPALHIFVTSFLPESPFYAYKCYGDSEKAKSAIRRINGQDYDVELDYMALEVLLCLTTVELVEFLGRKFMLNASAIGMALCLASMMLYQSFFPTTDICTSAIESNEWHKYVPIILVCLYLCSYSIGWGPIVALVYAEVVYFNKWFSSLIYAGGQLVLFLVAYTFYDANALLGFNKYVLCMYTASCVLSIVFVHFCVPETRALPLNRVLRRQSLENNCLDTRDK